MSITDSFYIRLSTQHLRLDMVPRNQPIESNMVCVASIYSDHDDDSSDLIQTYFRVFREVSPGNWVLLQDENYTYPLQRELQDELEQLAISQSGPWFCNTSFQFKYVHIPLHYPRTLSQALNL